MTTTTIADRFKALGHQPERYGNSYVRSDYKVPDDVIFPELSAGLDEMIDVYRSIFQSPAAPNISNIGPAAPYSMEDALQEVFLAKEEFSEILEIWKYKKNLILQGSPGVGKSFIAKRLAYALMGTADKTKLGQVQFHQSYSYDDFVQGYRPNEPSGLKLKNGIFYNFCKRALANEGAKYVFIIDEINRGNLSKIFGELMMLIEPDKRGKDWEMPLMYSDVEGDKFFVPDNVFILGLMNTADRSLSLVDYALRRRFTFVTIAPQFASPQFVSFLLDKGAPSALVEKIVDRITQLNLEIENDKANLGAGYCIGHSYFSNISKDMILDENWYRRTVKTEIEPLIREYWFDDNGRADAAASRLLA